MIDITMERKKSNGSENMADIYESLPHNDSENNNGVTSHRPYPLASRPSKVLNFATNLRCITEKSEGSGNAEQVNNDWEIEKDLTEEVFTRSGSDTSSLVSSPCTPYHLRNLSQLSSESMDDADISKSEPMQPLSQDLDIMAARRSSMPRRRSGFAFHFGDQAVPANAFVNTEVDSQGPKMLSVSEMMMKIGSDKKQNDSNAARSPAKVSSPKTYGSPTLDPQRKDSLRKAGAGPQRFSLIGLRKVSSSEIEEDLGFLHCLDDQTLHLTLYEQIALLWFDRRCRFVGGLIVGIALAVFIRIMLAITDYISRS